MLVEMIIGHNSKLLSDLNEDIRKDQGQLGLIGMLLEQLRFLKTDLTSQEMQKKASDELTRIQNRRIRVAHYIPNLFRYPTERSLYDMFAEARGLRIQRQYFTELEVTMERMVQEVSQLKTAIAEASDRDSERDRKVADERRNNLLVAIGVAQATGVFAGFASVFATIAAIDDDTKQVVPFVKEMKTEFSIGALHHSLASLTREAWVLMPTLGLICASISFIGAVSLIFLLARFGKWGALTAIATALILALLVWALASRMERPILGVVVFFCIAAVVFPIALYFLWRSPRERHGMHADGGK